MRGDIFKKTCEYILVLMMVCILLLTGCSESNDTDEDDMIKAEESSGISAVSLVIGSDNYEPYNYIDESGENVGIDVDIAKEACRRLGITPVFKQITWDRKDSFLDSNEIDCLWGSFTMSGRTDDYRWAGPYMYSRQPAPINALYNASLKFFAIPRHSPVDFISGPRLISAPRSFSKENTGILIAI